MNEEGEEKMQREERKRRVVQQEIERNKARS